MNEVFITKNCESHFGTNGTPYFSRAKPEGTNPILHSADDLCHSAFIVPANCFTIFTGSHSFVHGAFQVPTTMLVVVKDLFACRCKGLWCGV